MPLVRNWFQIHLSTAMVLLFVAGGFLWINTSGRILENHGTCIRLTQYFYSNSKNVARDAEDGGPSTETIACSKAEFMKCPERMLWVGTREEHYGWPREILASSTRVILGEAGFEIHASESSEGRPVPVKVWNGVGISVNVLIGIVILLFSWFVCEWVIARRVVLVNETALDERGSWKIGVNLRAPKQGSGY